MKHRRTGPRAFVAERTRSVRAIRAWRKLLPDWTPTLDQLRALDNLPSEHTAAMHAVTYGWPDNDARWDVLVALFEWHRREERHRWVTEEAVTEDTPTVMITTLKEEPGEDRAPRVREGRLAGAPVGQVPPVWEVHPQAAPVQPDPEPVQPEPGDGSGEDVQHDREGSARSRPYVERTAPGVYQVRTLWGAGLWRTR